MFYEGDSYIKRCFWCLSPWYEGQGEHATDCAWLAARGEREVGG
jgi:hypothetical protein